MTKGPNGVEFSPGQEESPVTKSRKGQEKKKENGESHPFGFSFHHTIPRQMEESDRAGPRVNATSHETVVTPPAGTTNSPD